MANLCWWYYISKLTEFVDTVTFRGEGGHAAILHATHAVPLFQVFFVMRKKDNQISLLHLYHHSLTPIETWICVKFIAGKLAFRRRRRRRRRLGVIT